MEMNKYNIRFNYFKQTRTVKLWWKPFYWVGNKMKWLINKWHYSWFPKWIQVPKYPYEGELEWTTATRYSKIYDWVRKYLTYD